MIKKIFTYVVLSIFSLSSPLGFVVAEENYEIHTLEDLPYDDVSHDLEFRENLLDESNDTTGVLGNWEWVSPKRIEYIADVEDIQAFDSAISLLAEKRVFEKKDSNTFSSELLIDSLGFSPFESRQLLSSFLSTYSGDILSVDARWTSFLEDYYMMLAPEISEKITTKAQVKQKKSLNSIKWTITYKIQTGTTIITSDGKVIDTTKIGLEDLDNSKKIQAKTKYEKKMKGRGNVKKWLSQAQVEWFEFWLSGSHLIFSQPVELTIDVPNMSDGNIVDLLTLHTGDTDFHTWGLSISSNTSCNSDGTASIPGSQAIVKNGKVVFYTCGASSFTMNPSGGTAGSNDLRAVIGDCGQIQLYYNNLQQIYTGNPALTWCTGAPSVWPTLRIWGTTYGNTFTAWTTSSTTGSVIGNTYTAKSTMTRVVGWLTYTLIIDWSHTAPNKYLTWSWRVIVPPTNAANVRFYYGMDTTVAWLDANDVGYLTSTGWLTFGVYDSTANVLSAFRYMSGQAWTAYEAWQYNTVRGKIVAGTNFANTITANADLGYGVNWDFGTTPGTYSGTLQWTLAPYVAANVPDLIPGIGAPEWPLTSNLLSQYPITVTNVGNLASSWTHTVILTVPTNIVGPSTSFSDNWWLCGAQVGTGVTCAKTTNISTPMGNDTLRIPVTPTTAASGTNVTFTVAIVNGSDSNNSNNTAFSTHPVVWWVATSPGWVPWATLWLKANSGTNCSTTWCTISTWSNSGTLGASANAITWVWTVTYDPINRINSNPTLYFNNASLNTNSVLNINTAAVSIFTVTKIATGWWFLIGTQTGTTNAVEWATTPTQDRFKLYTNVTPFYSGANSRTANIPSITTTLRQTAGGSVNYMNGRQVLSSVTPVTNFSPSTLGIGRLVGTNSTLTNLAETIIYPTGLTLTQKTQVESYLSLKYGITLDQTTPTDYIYSNGTTAWNATSAAVYKNNIAGIARDDTTSLSQLRSQSSTNTWDIIVARASIGTNRTSLIWWHDNSQVSTFTGVDSPFGFARISREWQFQEQAGDIGNVILSYPSSSVPSGMIWPLVLLVDDNGAFSAGATVYTGTLNGSNWDFSLNVSHLQYITFAKILPTDTTPPVITSINIASWTLIPTSNFTLTVWYSDTGSSIDVASFTGKIYSWNSTGATWDTTNMAPTYLSITWSTTSSTGQLRVQNLPFWKYRFDIIISDTLGNTLTKSYTYFVDSIEWTISSSIFPIGNSPAGIDTFWSGELVVTVRTVWAWFDLSMIRINDLTYVTDVIPVYGWGTWWWYSQWNGTSFPATITSHGTSQTLASVTKNINTNGQKNTFVYRLKYGVNPSNTKPAWDYIGNMSFSINLTY